MEDGESIYMWLGRAVDNSFLQAVFGVSSIDLVDPVASETIVGTRGDPLSATRQRCWGCWRVGWAAVGWAALEMLVDHGLWVLMGSPGGRFWLHRFSNQWRLSHHSGRSPGCTDSKLNHCTSQAVGIPGQDTRDEDFLFPVCEYWEQ